MSVLESVIWHVLGYMAMPTIFVMGFLAVVLVCWPVIRWLESRHERD